MMWNENAGGDETTGVDKQNVAATPDAGKVTDGAGLGNVNGGSAAASHHQPDSQELVPPVVATWHHQVTTPIKPVIATMHVPVIVGNGDLFCTRCARTLVAAGSEAMTAVRQAVKVLGAKFPERCYKIPDGSGKGEFLQFKSPRLCFRVPCHGVALDGAPLGFKKANVI